MRIPHRTSVEHDMQLLVSPGHVGGCVRTGEGVGSRVGGRRNDRGTGRGRGLLAGAGSVRCSAEGAGRAEGRQAWETRQAQRRARRYTRKTQVHARAIAAREQQRLLEVLTAEEATRNRTPTAHSLHSHRQAGRARLSPFAITQRQRERAVSGRPLAQGQGFPPTPPRQR